MDLTSLIDITETTEEVFNENKLKKLTDLNLLQPGDRVVCLQKVLVKEGGKDLKTSCVAIPYNYRGVEEVEKFDFERGRYREDVYSFTRPNTEEHVEQIRVEGLSYKIDSKDGSVCEYLIKV
jgi:hypothetical protein